LLLIFGLLHPSGLLASGHFAALVILLWLIFKSLCLRWCCAWLSHGWRIAGGPGENA